MSITLIENRRVAMIEISGAALLSSELIAHLGRAIDQAEDLGSAAVTFIRVVGRENGAALPFWPGQIDIQSVSRWERVLRRIERSDSTSIVLAEHCCSALALELLLVADRRLANSNFSVQWTGSGREIWPGMALYRLARQIGESRARKLSLEATDISAGRCLDLNIIDDIVDDLVSGSDLVPQLLGYAPADGFAVRRRLMQESLSASFDDALGVHLAACDRALRRPVRAEFATSRDGTSSIQAHQDPLAGR
jgi:isomerase DpgB